LNLQRRRRRLRWGGELLDGRDGLTQLLSEPRCGVSQPTQDLLAAFGLDLLAQDRLTARRVHRLQVDDVVTAEGRYGPGQQRFDALPLGDLARQLSRHRLTGDRPCSEESPGPAHWEDVQERLIQLHRLGLASVPSKTSPGVHEVGMRTLSFS
jgi:hypothetical protein